MSTNFSSTIISASKSSSSTQQSPTSSSCNGRRGYPSTTISDLVIAEAQYLSTLKRVGTALNLASNQTLASGRKASNTIRTLVERWTAMMRTHIKFHDDLVAAKDDIRGSAKLLSNLLLALDPVLVDHGRDLASAVYKMSRNDKKSGHSPSDWDVALRQPFDHLTVYNEWLQRIDPQGRLNREGLSQLNTLVLHVKDVIEANQNPRGVLKRISTFARGVIKRQPSLSQLTGSSKPTPQIAAVAPSTSLLEVKEPIPRGSVDLSHAVQATEIKPSPKSSIDTLSDQGSSVQVKAMDKVHSPSAAVTSREGAIPSRLLNRRSLARSDMSSVGSLTLAPSSESLNAKVTSMAASKIQRPNGPVRHLSTASQRQRYLEEREARKATLKMGAQAFITARAESLQHQSPGFVSRPSIDRLRTITKRDAQKKPPVKSLINFWEHAVDPIEV
ncbi:hypothetical protein BGZ70_000949 [Mortierella alpina]|uniref:Uncharacterized protein n=1 Tax=Mortierella alpina TaxID=64518 RepID=A0A9P6LYF5_MORAP|nr:hypothetical protein BGZ70_000949 [Mortierella alpina]